MTHSSLASHGMKPDNRAPTQADEIAALRAENVRLKVALTVLLAAADEVEQAKSHTYTARNGRQVGIQGDDGERVDLVHSDQTHALEIAATAARAVLQGSAK